MKKIKTGDTVQVMRGKDAGKVGDVLKVVLSKETNQIKVVVKGVNVIKRAQKPNPQLGIQGGFIEFEKPIDISNVMFIDKKTNKPTRVGFKVDEKTGKRVRISKKSGEEI